MQEKPVLARCCGKNFSLRRSDFPPLLSAQARVHRKGGCELKTYQMIIVGPVGPYGFRANSTRIRGNRCDGSRWSTGYLEEDRCREGQRARKSDEGSAGGDVHDRGKFKGLLAGTVGAADEYRDCKRKTRPLATLGFQFTSFQAGPRGGGLMCLIALGGPNRAIGV